MLVEVSAIADLLEIRDPGGLSRPVVPALAVPGLF